MLRLLQLMRVMAPPITAERLAVEHGVSVRSIYRDIDLLRLSGARIEGERGYGYRLIEDYALPPQTFDRLETEAITAGLGEVRQMGDPDLAHAAESVLAKVAATLPDDREQQLLHAISHVYRLSGRYGSHPHLQTIRQGATRSQHVFSAFVNDYPDSKSIEFQQVKPSNDGDLQDRNPRIASRHGTWFLVCSTSPYESQPATLRSDCSISPPQ